MTIKSGAGSDGLAKSVMIESTVSGGLSDGCYERVGASCSDCSGAGGFADTSGSRTLSGSSEGGDLTVTGDTSAGGVGGPVQLPS